MLKPNMDMYGFVAALQVLQWLHRLVSKPNSVLIRFYKSPVEQVFSNTFILKPTLGHMRF